MLEPVKSGLCINVHVCVCEGLCMRRVLCGVRGAYMLVSVLILLLFALGFSLSQP